MFRKPRETDSLSIDVASLPSTGRPPTPPNASARPSPTMMTHSSTKPLAPRPNSKSNVPTSSKPNSKRTAFSKTPAKSNASILTFFKKVDSPLKDDSIFLSQGSQTRDESYMKSREPSEDGLDGGLEYLYNDDNSGRFNEAFGPTKRRKLSGYAKIDNPADDNRAQEDVVTAVRHNSSLSLACKSGPSTSKSKKRRTGPFLSDSESDSDSDSSPLSDSAQLMNIEKWTENASDVIEAKLSGSEGMEGTPQFKDSGTKCPSDSTILHNQENSNGTVQTHARIIPNERGTSPLIPMLKKEATSVDDWQQFEDLDDFPEDEFADGEEFVERKWMEEQARIEAAEEALCNETISTEGLEDIPQFDDGMTERCPICSASLGGISSEQASRHVNGCLDGNPIPLVSATPPLSNEVKLMPPEASSRFARRAAIARPGQVNPFQLESGGATGPSTAFSAIMSGKAEDAAWANAAAAENASRGKPAYQRTCPFYKIMPGFFICVDAFRYGAVQGCNAYFLSHFHSDHYIGLTSTWCHGPIYCSKITANLVKQQLRVDPKWVVPLDFEVKSEVPGTQGVQITMIPANHCPGSSLFLLEKVVGKGANPKVQRILHCGDFRACPEHIAHPQLMPDLVDSITGKTRQQKIDVCYLDTTYLNPRYAFPSQEEVIKACADMCVSLKKERAEEGDAWEVVKRQRAGAGMTSFVNKSSTLKAEDNSIAMAIGDDKPRGRLLVVCGTYSIGKERICMGIARALDCKIWAPPGKMRICAALEDSELMSRMTDDPKEAQIHMQMLMEIRAETLQEYLNSYKPHFSRIVGFRPSGWNYRPPNSRFTDSPSTSTILRSNNWRSTYGMSELVPQRGSTREASCFGVPYSEHSSFRELTMFVCALRIDKVVPTVNVGSAVGRAKMKSWIEKWLAERRKGGVISIGNGEGDVRW